MASASVRVNQETKRMIEQIAARKGTTQADVISEAVARAYKDLFWQQTRDAFLKLREDSQAWQQYVAEAESLDAAAADGIVSEDWSEYIDTQAG